MAMPTFQPGVPAGAAATFTLEDELTQQAVQKRQAMLDQAEMRRLALAEKRQAEQDQIARERLKMDQAQFLLDKDKQEKAEVDKTLSNMTMGDIPDPETKARVQKFYGPGMFKQPFEEAPGPAQVGQPQPLQTNTAASPAYIGTPKERETAAQRERAQTYIRDLPEGPVKTAAQYEINTGKQPAAGLINPTQHMTPEMGAVVKDASGKVLPGIVSVQNGVALLDGKPLPPGAHAERAPTPKDPAQLALEEARLDKVKQDKLNNDADAETFKRLRADDDFLNMMALMFRKGMNLPTAGMGKEANGIKLLAAERAKELKISPEGNVTWTDPKTGVSRSVDIDIAANHAALVANTSARRKLTENYASVSAFLDTADRNSKVLESILSKVPSTDLTLVNEYARKLSTKVGSEDMAALNAMLPSVRAEYARVIQQPNLTGVLSDTARKEIGDVLPADATIGQLKIALKFLRQEGENRKKATKGQIDNFDQELHKVGAEVKTDEATPAKDKKEKKSFDELLKTYGVK